jgi:hypothetical protein
VDNNCPHCDAIILLPSFVAHYPQLPVRCHACRACFFPFHQPASNALATFVKRRCRACKKPLLLPKPATQGVSAQFLCPSCLCPINPTTRLTGWIDTLSQQYAPAIGAITLAIMAGGAVAIIITLFDPARRDAMRELWRKITVWLIGS